MRKAIADLQIDTRAARQVRRLSGGNQQKVTIGRWLTSGFRTLLCFDPTRGIDVGTKRQIYALLRALAAEGPAVLFFSSELTEFPLVCDRVITLYGGRATAELAGAASRRGDAAARNARPRHGGDGGVSTVEAVREGGALTWRRITSRHGWTIGVLLLLALIVPYWRSLSQQEAQFDLQALAIDVLPFALAAMAQAVVVISGGIDLSVGALMSVINVLSAEYMVDMSFRGALLYALALVLGALMGAFTGLVIVVSRIPDIVVTLAMLFVWGGVALLILEILGGGAPQGFLDLGLGTAGTRWLPTPFLVLAAAFVLVWLPLRRSRFGLALYAVGSRRSAAYLSGVNVARARVSAYVLGGAFAALGGLALTATSGLGDPNAGAIYTLNSVAAVVLGGVSLVGGGLIGPIAAAAILTLVKTVLILRGTDPNYAQVYQGLIIIAVVTLGSVAQRRRS